MARFGDRYGILGRFGHLVKVGLPESPIPGELVATAIGCQRNAWEYRVPTALAATAPSGGHNGCGGWKGSLIARTPGMKDR